MTNTTRNSLWVALATVLGGYLRFSNLAVPPLWIDEALLGGGYLTGQEFIGNLLVVHDDFWLRFPYALAGTLTIPAVYLVLKHKNLYAVWFVAVFPLFVFWSRLARPYALAGLFVVLGWRWWWMMFVALASTPVALLGTRVQHWPRILSFVAVAVGMYLIRNDLDEKDFLSADFLLNNPRLYYVPLLAGILYLCDYCLPVLQRRHSAVRKGDSDEVVEPAGRV